MLANSQLSTFIPALVLAIAAFLDYLIGDPWNWLHPVQVMGWGISCYTQFVLQWMKQPLQLKIAGVALGLGIVVASGWVGWGVVCFGTALHPVVGFVAKCVLLASCLAGRSLRHAAEDVLQPLEVGELVEARSRLSRYVGRDTEHLSPAEVRRAVLETVTENATDGMMAPLFWAIAGAFTPLGSAPFALAYKAASTLDSMVGYKAPPYTDLGWFSARMDDVLTWLPCRFMVLTLGVMSGRPLSVWQICWRDAPQDPSPNAGWSEAVYAAILGVQVGGRNVYRGQVKEKPFLGDALNPITSDRIHRAMDLTRWAVLIWLAIAIVLLLVFLPRG